MAQPWVAGAAEPRVIKVELKQALAGEVPVEAAHLLLALAGVAILAARAEMARPIPSLAVLLPMPVAVEVVLIQAVLVRLGLAAQVVEGLGAKGLVEPQVPQTQVAAVAAVTLVFSAAAVVPAS
jgi:hypothetical protein